MRIAYVNYRHQSGVTASMLSALRRQGHEVADLAAVGELEPRFLGARLPRPAPLALLNLFLASASFGRQGLSYRWKTPFAFDRHSRRAGELLRELPARPDLVLQNGALFSPGLPPELPYALLLDNTTRREVESPPHPEAGVPPALELGASWHRREREVYAGARRIFCFSRPVRDSLVRHYAVDPRRICVVGAGANVVPEQPRRRDDGRTLLFVGKEWERKGGPVLARAFTRLRRSHPHARLDVLGPRRRPRLPEGAAWHGFVPLEQAGPFFEGATAFVLPTLREPFGLAFLDAMAHGLPCIGTDLEAVPEMIATGETGILVPPQDEVALADAMALLLDHPARARWMGAAGRRRVLEHFSWDVVAARVVEDWAQTAARAG
jgi:glycosyltransferase involved in cell wall biosynthesis